MRANVAIRISIAVLLCVGLPLCGEAASLELPAQVTFLDVAPNAVEGRFVLKGGRVYVEGADGKTVEGKVTPITEGPLATYQGQGVYVLGAPAVVFGTRTVDVPDSVADERATVRGSLLEDGVVFVREKRVADSSNGAQVVTSFSVYRAKGSEVQPLQTFSFRDNVYNQYLDQVWPLDRRLLAIVTRSSRHQAISTLFLFDLERLAVVGMREFSRFQYLPERRSFWMMQSVANCENMDQMLDIAKERAVVVPIYTANAISEGFKDVAGITQSGASR